MSGGREGAIPTAHEHCDTTCSIAGRCQVDVAIPVQVGCHQLVRSGRCLVINRRGEVAIAEAAHYRHGCTLHIGGCQVEGAIAVEIAEYQVHGLCPQAGRHLGAEGAVAIAE